MKILVTGAGGFIGSHLVPVLSGRGHDVLAASRRPPGSAWVASPELGPAADWKRALVGVDAVVHLAGRAHANGERATPAAEEEYRRINADGTTSLARQAARAGVRRFLFLSSCHAVATESESRLTEETIPRPDSAYGRSKLAAEHGLKNELSGTSCAHTILRPPLVYGPDNPANFARLMSWVAKGIPLPIASVRNRRSFVGVQNLADAIATCLESPRAAHRTYYPGDGADLSSADLVRAVAAAARRSPRLFSTPETALRLLARLPGGGALRKLIGSLYVDDSALRKELDWTPPLTLAEGLRLVWRADF